jgi:hypothetical protein
LEKEGPIAISIWKNLKSFIVRIRVLRNQDDYKRDLEWLARLATSAKRESVRRSDRRRMKRRRVVRQVAIGRRLARSHIARLIASDRIKAAIGGRWQVYIKRMRQHTRREPNEAMRNQVFRKKQVWKFPALPPRLCDAYIGTDCPHCGERIDAKARTGLAGGE